jgi:glycosyltransferase involved in cell wall biosynthesis
MLKIAIDATPMVLYRGGIGYFAKEMIRQIVAMDSDDKIVLFYGVYHHEQYDLSCGPNVSIVRCPLPRRLVYIMDYFCPIPIEDFVGRVDVVHGTTYYVNTRPQTRSIITVHDLAYKILPHTFNRAILRSMEVRFERDLAKAALILAVSENTKRDLQRIFGIDGTKIRVTHEGVNAGFKRYEERDVLNNAIKNLNIKRKFLLHVGSFEPRKNLGRLLEAYFKLRDEKKIDHQLVLVGNETWLSDDLFRAIGNSKYNFDILIFRGIPEDQLIALYNAAELLIYPSLYEGFGLPLVEAMACGTPIAASGVSSIPEVAGDAAIYFDPYSVEEISNRIIELISSDSLKATLSRNGLERAKLFTWEKAAQAVIQAYKDVCSK